MKSWNEIRKAATAFVKRWKNADRVAHLFCTLLTFLCATFDVALGDTRTELDIFAVHYAPKWYSRLGAT